MDAEFLKRLGISIARGVPQMATGMVDLAALPFTMTGLLDEKDVVGGTEYLTQRGMLPPAQEGLLNETTELVSSALNPASAVKGGLLGLGALGTVAGSKLSKIPSQVMSATEKIKTSSVNSNLSEFLENQKIIPSNENLEPQGSIRLFHSGSDPISGGFFESVPKGGIFDGFFALPNRYGNYGTGAKYYSDIKEDRILNNYNLNYDMPYEIVKKAFTKTTGTKEVDDDFELLWKAIVEDNSQNIDQEDLLRITNKDNFAEASFEAQKLRGKLAKNMGYDAVEMNDENGVSYLITSGVKLNRDAN